MKLAGMLFLLVIAPALSISMSTSAMVAVASKSAGPLPTPTPALTKVPFESYRGVTVGMPQFQAREKLGEASQRSNAGDYFVFSETESAQVLWDKEQKVKSITINYTGNLKLAPSAKDVLGEDVNKETDGSVYKLVRYPDAGFWVSYNRTAGDGSTVVVTLQKLNKQ